MQAPKIRNRNSHRGAVLRACFTPDVARVADVRHDLPCGYGYDVCERERVGRERSDVLGLKWDLRCRIGLEMGAVRTLVEGVGGERGREEGGGLLRSVQLVAQTAVSRDEMLEVVFPCRRYKIEKLI